MSTKKIAKIFTAIIVVMMVLSIITTVFAANPLQFSGTTPSQTTDFDNMANRIVGALTYGGMALAVIMLIVIGIKYMVGSAEEKAEYKKTLVPYVVGAILIFAASIIANFVYNFIKS